MLLLVGPYIDQAVSQRWIADYSWSNAALQQLLLSCGLAVLVNVSQFMCLGRFSAVTFQVQIATYLAVLLPARLLVANRPLSSLHAALMSRCGSGW
jgi:solute carrier family 35 protein E3